MAVDLTSVDEYTMYRYQRNEMLDLDHLCPAVPLFVSMAETPGALPPVADLALPDASAVPHRQRIGLRQVFLSMIQRKRSR